MHGVQAVRLHTSPQAALLGSAAAGLLVSLLCLPMLLARAERPGGACVATATAAQPSEEPAASPMAGEPTAGDMPPSGAAHCRTAHRRCSAGHRQTGCLPQTAALPSPGLLQAWPPRLLLDAARARGMSGISLGWAAAATNSCSEGLKVTLRSPGPPTEGGSARGAVSPPLLMGCSWQVQLRLQADGVLLNLLITPLPERLVQDSSQVLSCKGGGGSVVADVLGIPGTGRVTTDQHWRANRRLNLWRERLLRWNLVQSWQGTGCQAVAAAETTC